MDHGALFRSYTITKPINFATAGDQIVACFEPDDLGTLMMNMDSPVNVKAMAADGVRRETVKVFVLVREFKV